ncbi:MAG: cell division/cell wall cluster transcriptional repressor MraZ [Patescibacteria group bacterium]
MFLGSWEPSFDKLNRRIALPKKIRDYLATSTIILSFGFERCIFGFDSPAWEKESQTQLARPLADRGARDIRRLFFSSAEPVALDNQGRFVIPVDLFNWAQIEKPVVIGAGDHFEIWDETNWLAHKQDLTRQ